MPRKLKLFVNLFLSSLVFTYFIQVLILLLNSHLHAGFFEFVRLFVNLYLFYGPVWILLHGTVFLAVQFFSEKRYPIGFMNPPTLTYFFSFTVLIISFILYFNYDYYFNFLEGWPKTYFIQILFINLALVITGVVFIFFKKINKKWIQFLFLSVLGFNILFSYFICSARDKEKDLEASYRYNPNKGIASPLSKPASRGFEPRKIRIVLMDGLSLTVVKALNANQKLWNFNEIIREGVSGNIDTFEPNMGLSMLNSALTGLRPSQLPSHSYEKFKFAFASGLEFDVRPRYILFRKCPLIKISRVYNINDSRFLDDLRRQYESNNQKAAPLIVPLEAAAYSRQELNKNNRFTMLFPDIVKSIDTKDEKFNIVRTYFFMDDYIKHMVPDLRSNDIYYSIVRFPGLEVVSKYLYQYHMPQVFGGFSEEDLKIKKYGTLLEKYYEYYDSIIGNMLSRMGNNELLVILSFFEYEPLPLWRRILVHLFGQKDVYVYIPLESKGTILLYDKKALKRGYPLKNISIYDIFPTLLYYSGFRSDTDWHRKVVREIFTDEFLLNNPID
ncbi:MAG: hypothetical protein ACM3SY_11595 [Candidatus Omnitrophota bacterium]